MDSERNIEKPGILDLEKMNFNIFQSFFFEIEKIDARPHVALEECKSSVW